MPKLLITRRYPDEIIAAARAEFDVTYRDETTPMAAEDLTRALQDYDAILLTLRDVVSGDVIAAADPVRCKMLGNFGVGYNHIDVTAARAAGMQVSNTPGAVTDATADTGMTLILMTCRRAGEGERIVRRGDWTGWHPTELLGTHVTGRTLGVIGMGRIGKAIAKRCHDGFGMDVVFHNRSQVADPGLPARQVADLTELMETADIAVVTVPATPETHHLIDADALRALGPDGILINIARGDIVDEAALIAALQSGTIRAAGLDVYEFEPKVPDALKALENVTLLPHLGTAVPEVRGDMGMMALANLIAWKEGRDLPNPV